jgi:hypothetical protein
MSSNLKSNWANSSSIKPWRSHGRKKSVYNLKSKFLNILNMDEKHPKIIWVLWSQWHNWFVIWNSDAKVKTTTAVFLLFHSQSIFMEVGNMRNMGSMGNSQWSVESKWVKYLCMEKMSSIPLDPLKLIHLPFNHAFLPRHWLQL